MKRTLNFTKMHGLGNDFIIINTINQRTDNLNSFDLAKNLCHRHFGIGADGLILVEESKNSDIKMRIINSDGSEAEMCGNGIRCFSKYLYENDILNKEVFSVETKAGVIVPSLIIKDGKVIGIEVDMGIPILERKDIPMKGNPSDLVISEKLTINGSSFNITCVSMGNPHAVIFVDNLQDINLETLGPLFENHPIFPEKINTEFIQIKNRNEAFMLVWERGAGKTMACGTGACASVVAGVLNNKLNRKAKIHLPGGTLSVEWQETDDHIVLTGPSKNVFHGEIILDTK
jgi:diaminopimelate epimerase